LNRIDDTFKTLRSQKKSALIPFLTVGDPSIEVSIEIILHMENSGADLIELGVPYSDPLADGPVIQRSSERALTHHITILDVIQVASEARRRGSKLPFILFTYYNPVLQMGVDHIFRLMQENDISGIIIPDLPLEEDEDTKTIAIQYGIHVIPLIAPTSHKRIKQIAAKATGFVYCVSSMGVTGERSEFYQGIENFIQEVRSATSLPVVVGFGISTREQVEKFERLSDGVVVGSAIVRVIESVLPLLQSNATSTEAHQTISQFISELKGTLSNQA
jgi:tryptophan synthase alpha chain